MRLTLRRSILEAEIMPPFPWAFSSLEPMTATTYWHPLPLNYVMRGWRKVRAWWFGWNGRAVKHAWAGWEREIARAYECGVEFGRHVGRHEAMINRQEKAGN